MSGAVLHRSSEYMAISRSLAMGRARKSAGDLTFRTVRGRTIVSQKRGRNAVQAEGETALQFEFALVSRFIRMHRASIDLSFNKSKYGSQGNFFQGVNKAGMRAAMAPLFQMGTRSRDITDEQIETAVTAYAKKNPTVIYRVLKTGSPTVYLTGAWDDGDTPAPPTAMLGITRNDIFHKVRFDKGVVAETGLTAGFSMKENEKIIVHAPGIGDALPTEVKYHKSDGALAATKKTTIEKVDKNSFSIGADAEDPFGEAFDLSFIVLSGTPAGVYDGSMIVLVG